MIVIGKTCKFEQDVSQQDALSDREVGTAGFLALRKST
jgi:hypothetical protein